MRAIGFAEKFYTLWDIRVDQNYFTDAYGNHHLSNTTTYYTYLKNISTDRDKALQMYPELSINEELRGKSRDWYEKSEDLTPHILKFGKHCGKSIHELVELDFGYLLWLRENGRWALRQLIEQMPEILAHDEKVAADKAAKMASYVRATDGVQEVAFAFNPRKINVEENPWLPEIDELLSNTPNGYIAESMMGDSARLFVIFPNGKRVESMYPYNMVEIAGKMTKTKNKAFTLNLKIEITLASEYGVTQFATINQ